MRAKVEGRIFELDFLRGIALILMCLDHLVYDLSCLPYWFPLEDHPLIRVLGEFGDAVSFSEWRLVLHYIFATLFLLLAGIGSSLTRHPLRRAGRIAAAAVVLSAGTVLLDLFFQMGATIVFGVLSAMAVGVFLCWVCSRLGGKWTALVLGILFIAVGFFLKWYEAPSLRVFYGADFLGVAAGTVRYGSDWFPVFPCCGVVLVGYFLGKVLYRSRQSLVPPLRGKTCFLCVVGRKPLLIYLLHQPVIIGVLYGLIFLLVRI